jgi:hypothetical protein
MIAELAIELAAVLPHAYAYQTVPFLLRQLMLRPTMDTLLGDDVRAPLAPPDSARTSAFARRDYAYLAIAFCRCMNIPARYCTGYLGGYRHPAAAWPDGHCRLVRGLYRRALAHA